MLPPSLPSSGFLPEVLMIAAQSGQIIFTSANVGELWGYTVETMLTHTLLDCFDSLQLPSDPIPLTQNLTLRHSRGYPVPVTVTITAASLAEQQTYICSIRPLGIPTAWSLSTGSPTSPSLAATSGESQGVPIPIMDVVDSEGRILFVNDRCCQVLGYSPTELLGQSHRLLHTAPYSCGSEQGTWLALPQGQIWVGERSYRHKNGSLYPVDSIVIPLGTVAQSALQILTVAFEPSKDKDCETQLALFREELVRSSCYKDEFLARLSHEFRTPLNTILGMAEGLQDQVFGPIAPAQHKALEAIERNGSHLLSLINSILDFAHMEVGQLSLNKQPTAVIPLCQSCVSLLKSQADRKKIHIVIEHPPILPEIFVDERRIRQALIHLLSNAIKFTPQGGSIILSTEIISHPSPPPVQSGIVRVSIFRPAPSAATPTLDPDHLLRISVADTGIGIAETDRERLFKPFIQLDSPLNREQPGTGLGLALVKWIVEQHGGTVGVNSQLGIGSCFTLDLPILAVPVAEPAPPPKPSPPNAHPLVLFVNNDEPNIQSFTSYLHHRGYSVIVVKQPEEIKSIALQTRPDLMVVDASTLGSNGLDTLRDLHQSSELSKIPMIALIERDQEGGAWLQAGGVETLRKPIKLKQLTTLLQQYSHLS